MIFFLGLDGCDMGLAKLWDCRSLLQAEHGTLEVPINKWAKVPLSPEVWASFLTGEMQSDMEFQVDARGGVLGVYASRVLGLVRRHVPLSLGLGRKIVRRKTYPALSKQTFVDDNGVAAFNVPYRGYDEAVLDLDMRWSKGAYTFYDYVAKVYELYHKRKNDLLGKLAQLQKAHACFAYLDFPDNLEHVHLHAPHRMKAHYLDLDGFVHHIKQLVNADPFIIIADHGFNFETGLHSLCGYYSSSRLLNPKPRAITDFYRMLHKDVKD